MITLNKTINVNGISEVAVEGERIQVAYITSSIGADGKFNINRTIQNKEVFDLNKDSVLKDFSAFDEYVYKLADSSKNQWEDAKNAESA